MAIGDDRLKQFFSKQKVGAFDALKKPAVIISKSNFPNEIQINSSLLENKKIDLGLKNPHIQHPDPVNSSAAPITEKISATENSHSDVAFDNLSESLANRERLVSYPLANQEQFVNKPLAIHKQTVSNSLSEPFAKPLAKQEDIQFTDLRVFSKKERELLTLIFWQCHSNCSLVSPVISTEEIRSTLKISAERVRNLIFRISKKGGVHVAQHKSGQSAYRVFELPKSLYQSMIDQQNNKMARMIEPLAIPLSQPLAMPTISSSFLNNKKITTSLPEDWKKINFDALIDLGFSETQLMQIYQTGGTNPQVVQESINHFAYSLEHNEKTKAYTDPLNVFMGVLRKGQKWNEPNYISPQELALRQMLDGKKREKERRDLMIKELVDVEFPEWRAKLTESQIKLIVPEATLRTNITAAITAAIRSHFVESILLPRLEKIGIVEN